MPWGSGEPLQHLVKGVACSGSASTKVTLAALKEEEGEQRWEQGTSLEATMMIKAKDDDGLGEGSSSGGNEK